MAGLEFLHLGLLPLCKGELLLAVHGAGLGLAYLLPVFSVGLFERHVFSELHLTFHLGRGPLFASIPLVYLLYQHELFGVIVYLVLVVVGFPLTLTGLHFVAEWSWTVRRVYFILFVVV